MARMDDARNKIIHNAKEIGETIKHVFSELSETLIEHPAAELRELLEFQLGTWKENIESAEEFKTKMDKMYEDLAKQRKRNFDKEIEDLKKMYNERIALVKGNEEEIARLKEEMNARIKRVEAEREAILTPEEIRRQEQAKVAEVLGLKELKVPQKLSVGGVVGEVTKAAGVETGIAGQAIGQISGIVQGVLSGVPTLGLAIGAVIGIVSIVKKIEEHNKENLENSRKIAVNTGLLAEFSVKQYTDLIHEVRSVFGVTRQEAQKLIEAAFSFNAGTMEAQGQLLGEFLRVQRETGLSFNDFTKNLRFVLGQGGSVGALGVLYDMVVDLNREFREAGLHFVFKELWSAVNDAYSTLRLWGGQLSDGVGIMEQFKEVVDEGIFTFKDFIDIEKKLISQDADKLAGLMMYGEQLGALSELTGDIYDDMWKIRTQGAVGGTELFNTVLLGVKDIITGMGGSITESMELGYEIATKQFGLSMTPIQWQKLVQLWEKSGEDFSINRMELENLVNETGKQHEERVRSSTEYYNKAIGFFHKMANDVSNIAGMMLDLVKSKTSSYE